jgi:hypothetical protein
VGVQEVRRDRDGTDAGDYAFSMELGMRIMN